MCWPSPSSSSIRELKISIGPAIENGFYYDFEFPDGVVVTRAGLPGDRSPHARAREGRRALRARRSARDGGPRAVPRGAPGLQGRADRRPRSAPRVRATPSRPSRSIPTDRSRTSAAVRTRPSTAADRRLQAAVRRRRLLARGLQPHDAHPRLRNGLLHQQRARRLPRAPRAGPRTRPPQAGAGARPLPVL